MLLMKYDLVIAYRIYPKVSKKPFIYNDDKFKLSEIALKSFVNSLWNLKIKFYALLDWCPVEYELLFKKYLTKNQLEIVKYDSIWNKSTFKEQINILLQNDDAEFVYFAEDDYLYLKDSMVNAIDFMRSNKTIDYLSLYDHVDYYTTNIHRYKSKIYLWVNRHYRSVSSTCMTFLTRSYILKKDRNILLTYSKWNHDCSMRQSITKINIFNMFSRTWLYYTYYSWIFWISKILFGRKRVLVTPIPSLATHMESTWIAPIINWKIFKL